MGRFYVGKDVFITDKLLQANVRNLHLQYGSSGGGYDKKFSNGFL